MFKHLLKLFQLIEHDFTSMLVLTIYVPGKP